MTNLVLKGKVQVDGMEFNHIEGGFGPGKKAMLAMDIAKIHGRELKDINRLVNNNASRFKEGIDIIDFKKLGDLKSLSLKMGYNNQSYANANNIYAFSERGYAKLLKILEDDFAWEQYEKLVDGYFNMRKVSQATPVDDIKRMEIEARIKNARVREAGVLLKIAEKADIPPTYKQVLYSHASRIISGSMLLPLPETERTYSAKDIGDMIGMSSNRIGRVANSNNLKTPEYGVLVWDKSPHSSKQIQSFRYNEKGKNRLIELCKEG